MANDGRNIKKQTSISQASQLSAPIITKINAILSIVSAPFSLVCKSCVTCIHIKGLYDNQNGKEYAMCWVKRMPMDAKF